MERQVSFDVTDYYSDGDKWSTVVDVVDHNEPTSGPSSPNREMKNPDQDATEEYVFITLDIHEDTVSVVSVKPFFDGALSQHGNQSAANQEKKSSEDGPIQNRKFEASEALRGVNMLISMTDAGWIAVEKRFHKLRAKTNGFLLRSKFGECVGINSKEFALELFDMLARRWRVTGEAINQTALRKFWCQITDQSLDSRLKIFFAMADKDGDGRVTEDEVKEFIRLTASANNKPMTQNMANEYAVLIMKELDPDKQGYISMEILELLLLDVETLCELTRTEETNKLTKRWRNCLK